MGGSRLHRLLVALAMLTASCTGAGGFLEGGQSGTGVAAIVGNVAAVSGTGDVSQIQVTVEGSSVVGVTDAAGDFALSGDVSGPEVLLFERERDGLRAEVQVVVPAGGRLELGDIEIEAEDGRAIPTQRFVEFEGTVETVDCVGGEMQIRTRLEGATSTFVLFLADAFVHDAAGTPVSCAALSPGVEVEVRANVDDLGQLSNADVEVHGELGAGGEGEAQDQMGQGDQEPQDGGAQEAGPNQEDPASGEGAGDSDIGADLASAELPQ